MKTVRADLVIATCALLISAGATLSSLYQTHVIANQLSSSVWPYLDIDMSRSRSSMQLAVANDGLGPALIRSATLAVDGHTVVSYRGALDILERGMHLRAPYNGTFSSIGPDTVLRPAERLTLVDVSALPVARFGALERRVAFDVCYCSLLEQCWVNRSGAGESRVQVASCPTQTGLDF